MTNTARLLDKAREMCSPPTWYQLAKRLEIAHSTISRATRHGGMLDNAAAFRLAKMLRLPQKDVIAYIELDRAKDETAREFWRCQSPRLVPAAILAATLAGFAAGNLNPEGLAMERSGSPHDQIYIMRIRPPQTPRKRRRPFGPRSAPGRSRARRLTHRRALRRVPRVASVEIRHVRRLR